MRMNRAQAEAIIRYAYPSYEDCPSYVIAFHELADVKGAKVLEYLTDEGIFALAALITDQQLDMAVKLRNEHAQQMRAAFTLIGGGEDAG